MKALRFFAITLLFSVCFIAEGKGENCHGRVFDDRNGNGILDSGERGVAGVVVSDGFKIVTTDEKGVFDIVPGPRARFITVCTPDGYSHTNRFFRDIRGCGGRLLNGSNPGLEFGLKKKEYGGGFIHMSDIESWEYKDWIDDIKKYVSVHNPDFVAVTGDICYEKGLSFYPFAMNDGNVGCRMVYTVGNHDLIKGAVDPLGNPYGEKMFEDCFGPAWYSFTAAGVHYIVTPMLAGDAKPSYSLDDLVSWIRNDLEYVPEDTPIILFNHDAAAQLLPEGRNVRALVYGHRHSDLRTEDADGVLYICSTSPGMGWNDHSGSAFREISVDTGGVVRTKLHFTPIAGQIVAHEVSGSITAVIYDSASGVDRAEVVSESGRKVRMKRCNDFMWTADLGRAASGKDYKVRATFSDGEVRIASRQNEPGLKWMVTLPCRTAFCNPVLSGGRLYVAGTDSENGENCGVYCLDSSSGSILWRSPTVNSVKGDIALEGGLLYAADVECNVYAIDPVDGSVKWRVQLEHPFYPSFTEGIVVHNGLVYAGTGSSLCALDAVTGAYVWKNGHKHNSITNVCTDRIADGALLANGYWVGRFCYDSSDGSLLWEKKDTQNRYSTCTPAVEGDTFVYTGRNSIWQVAARTGEVLKQADYPYRFDTRSEPLIADGRLYVGTSDAGLLAVDLSTMKKTWLFATKPSLIYTSPYSKSYEKSVECSPVLFGENVVFGANDGYVYCIRRSDGAFVWRINVGLPVISRPSVDSDRMFISDFGGNIYCYGIQ